MRLPPPGNRTVAIAESGLMAAVGAVLYLCWFNPVLYVLSVTLTPMPLTVLASRYGAGVGLLGLACTACGVAAFLGPAQAAMYTGLFGVLGFITGWLLFRKLPPGRMIVEGSLLVFVYDLFGYYVLERLVGLEDSIAMLRDGFLGTITSWKESVPNELVPYLNQLYRDASDILVLPLALFFAAAFTAFIANYVISLVVLRHLGMELAFPPGLLFFRAPAWAGAACLLFVLFAGAARGSQSLQVRVAYLNVEMLVKALFSAEALSLFLCVLNMTRLAVAARFASLLGFFLLFPIWWLIGVADSLFDLRSAAVRWMP